MDSGFCQFRNLNIATPANSTLSPRDLRIRKKHLDLLPATERSEAEGMSLAELVGKVSKEITEKRGWDAYASFVDSILHPPTTAAEITPIFIERMRGRLMVSGPLENPGKRALLAIKMTAYLAEGGLWRKVTIADLIPYIEEITEKALDSKTLLSVLRGAFLVLSSPTQCERIDGDPYLLPVGSGKVVNLRTGIVESLGPEHLMSAAIDTHWNPSAKTPRIERLLSRASGSQDSRRRFLQMAIGQALVRGDRWNRIILFAGDADTTHALLRSIAATLHPFASYETYSTLYRTAGGGRSSDERDLRLLRCIDGFAPTTDAEKELERITSIGGVTYLISIPDRITVEKRVVNGKGIISVPITLGMGDQNESSPSHQWGETYGRWSEEERSDLLRWLVDGAIEFERSGGNIEGDSIPTVIREDTNRRLTTYGHLPLFLRETMMPDGCGRINTLVLWDLYHKWCERRMKVALPKETFARWLDEMGHETIAEGDHFVVCRLTQLPKPTKPPES